MSFRSFHTFFTQIDNFKDSAFLFLSSRGHKASGLMSSRGGENYYEAQQKKAASKWKKGKRGDRSEENRSEKNTNEGDDINQTV
jgi:hypothetical protein